MAVELTAAVEPAWHPDKDSGESRQALNASNSGFQESNASTFPQRHSRKRGLMWFWVGGILIVAGGLSAIGVIMDRMAKSPRKGAVLVHKVAFSSCTQRIVAPNPIWEKAIIPSQPDAWLWLGDMAYMDMPPMDCDLAENSEHPDCNCKHTYLQHPHRGCLTGDLQNAQRKTEGVIRSDGYRKFIEYMCPGAEIRGEFPPAGGDRGACPRAILGTYDDHDFGWNNGNGEELPNRDAIKQVFLDALGEPETSVRRNSLRGIHMHTRFNEWDKRRAIDVILLDERYHRVPLPCHVRRDFCWDGVHKGHNNRVWCKDFIGDPKKGTPAACCTKDEDIILGWCQIAANRQHPNWAAACDPWHADFGKDNWVVDTTGELRVASGKFANETKDESGFCEVLGKVQRAWLKDVISASDAPVLLVASGSVVLGAPSRVNKPTDDPPYTGYCSGDDWDCYRPAQQNLLATLSTARGCVIILTGDYHSADIKRLDPLETAPYSGPYLSKKLKKPIFQVMASGMHPSTASGLETGCNDTCCSFNRDEDGLRGPGKECNIYGDPNFGIAEFDWDSRRVNLRIMRGDGTGIASGADGVAIKMVVDIDTCSEVTV